MGDRITIDITDGESYTPTFYGHWCGLRAIKTLNDLVRSGEGNGIQSLLCNFITEIMERRPQKYSYYLYNHGEAEGAADWDNYSWCFDVTDRTWSTTDPQFSGRRLTMDEADEFVKVHRPCLYRECRCEDYGKPHCARKFLDEQEKNEA